MTNEIEQNSAARSRLLWLIVLLILGAGGIWLVTRETQYEYPESLSVETRQEATRYFQKVYRREPEPIDVVSVAAEMAVKSGELETAVDCFALISTEHPVYGHQARSQQGQVLMKLNRADAAEAQFRAFLSAEQSDPQSPPTHLTAVQEQLRYLLEVQLRFEERKELLQAQYERGLLTPHESLFFCFPSLLRWNGPLAVERCRKFYEEDPHDTDVAVAWAQYLGGTGKTEKGLKLIASVLKAQPDHRRALGVKLFLLNELARDEQFEQVASQISLPPAPDDPWLLLRMRGQAALQMERTEEAERCFQYLLAADPANSEAYLRLATIAGSAGNKDRQEDYFRVANLLARIQNRLGGAQFEAGDPNSYLVLADLCLEAGLGSQAQVMLESALQVAPDHAEALQKLSELNNK